MNKMIVLHKILASFVEDLRLLEAIIIADTNKSLLSNHWEFIQLNIDFLFFFEENCIKQRFNSIRYLVMVMII